MGRRGAGGRQSERFEIVFIHVDGRFAFFAQGPHEFFTDLGQHIIIAYKHIAIFITNSFRIADVIGATKQFICDIRKIFFIRWEWEFLRK